MPDVKIIVGAGDVRKEITAKVEEGDAAPWGMDAKLAVVGTEVPRVDGLAKANGGAKYTADVNRPNMAFARVVRCPHARAKVVSVSLDDAKALPGVLAVERVGGMMGDEARFPGHPVVAVCADTEAHLEDAIAAIRVEYQVLPHVVETEAAMAEGATQVDPKKPNVNVWGGPKQGDPDAALAAAEVRVTAEYRTQVQTHSALEPHGSVAEPDGQGGLTVWCSTQGTFSVRRDLAGLTKLPEAKVRVLTDFMGGGFGAKFGADVCDRVAAHFALALGRPVKCMNDRREEHLVGGNRPDSIQRLTLAGKKDGTLTAIVGETFGTAGTSNGGGTGCANTGLYGIPNQRVPQAAVATNTAIGRAFRAPGHPQGVYALEGMVDEFAHAIGMDPLDVRRLNDQHPIRRLEWPIGAQKIEWAKHRRKVPGSDPGPVKRGLGCAGGVWGNFGGGDHRVDLTVGKDGSVTVLNGAQDIGTGTKTVLAIVVAEELGIQPGAVTVRIGDTTLPPGPGSGGSVTAVALAPAAREAAVRAREGLAAAVAKAWGAGAEDLRFEGGKVKGPGGKEAVFATACSALEPAGLSVTAKRRPNYASFHGQNGGVQFAQVAVDVETGIIRVERVVAVHDAGRVVNELTARSQVNGGVIQGISYALFEDRRLDRASGDMVNPTLDTYKIVGMADCPQIDVTFLPAAIGHNNVGMMGLGEPATVPTAAAVGNAVFNAIGVRLRELPMTPARVLAALAAAKGGAK